MPTPTDLTALAISEAAALLRRRKVSPVELVRAHLERVESLNPRLNAFITITADLALAQARQAEAEMARGDYRGPLHGIPLSLKDLYYTAGVRTTAGSRVLGGFVPSYDATAWRRLKEAGAVLLGKCNLHEFAFGTTNANPHYGNALNPWDTSRVPGGSSGGSAAAVASGMGLASLGSDTGGSIRIPAALCGVVGLKPTYGLVSRYGVVPLSWSLDHCGPITRTARDCALVLSTIAGPDPEDPSSLRARTPSPVRGLNRPLAGLRMGLPRRFFFEGLDPGVAQCVREALSCLEGLGVRPVEVDLPSVEHSVLVGMVLSPVEAAVYHEMWLRERPGDYGADVLARLRAGALHLGVTFVQAQRLRRAITGEFLEAFRVCDFMVSPTCPIPAPLVGQERVEVGGQAEDVHYVLTRFTRPANLTGMPALSVPCGFTSGGLPVGLQLMGPPLSEGLLLRVAHRYEQEARWHRHRPPV